MSDQRTIQQIHDEWVLRHADSTPADWTSDKPGGGDYSEHHVDVSASPEAEAEFQRELREVFPLYSERMKKKV